MITKKPRLKQKTEYDILLAMKEEIEAMYASNKFRVRVDMEAVSNGYMAANLTYAIGISVWFLRKKDDSSLKRKFFRFSGGDKTLDKCEEGMSIFMDENGLYQPFSLEDLLEFLTINGHIINDGIEAPDQALLAECRTMKDWKLACQSS